jgi:hypothetical protein
MIDFDYPFLNFLLNPARPIRPEPSRSMVVGSGMGLNVKLSQKTLLWLMPTP